MIASSIIITPSIYLECDVKLENQQCPIQDERERVEVSSPWFKMKIDDISWKTIIVVGMILASLVYLVKG